MKSAKTSSAALRPYRVFFDSSDIFFVDVLASSEDEARDKAEDLHTEVFTLCENSGVWQFGSSEEIDLDKFNPPNLPADE